MAKTNAKFGLPIEALFTRFQNRAYGEMASIMNIGQAKI
jgi:hypothetical protein